MTSKLQKDLDVLSLVFFSFAQDPDLLRNAMLKNATMSMFKQQRVMGVRHILIDPALFVLLRFMLV